MGRIEAARRAFAKEGCEAFLITKQPDWRYLVGFRGDYGHLVVTPTRAALVTVGNYIEEATRTVTGAEVVGDSVPAYGPLRDLLAAEGVTRLAFEADGMTVADLHRLESRLEGVQLVPTERLVEEIRAVKDAGEVEAIRRAHAIADLAMKETLPILAEGTSERRFALALEVRMRQMGSEGVAFPTIALSGPRGSLPHGVPGERTVRRGEFFTVDWGAVWDGYRSDCTRTFAVGHVDETARSMYDAVGDALLAATEAARPGARVSEVDAAARDLLSERGLGAYFVHGVGHGVGLEIHESPALAPRVRTVLKPGMVVTVEPGVYIPGTGGIRLEDTLLITEDGAEVLTGLPKNLEIL